MKNIKLTQGKFALVDDELFDQLNQFKWFAHKGPNTFYARRNIQLSNGNRMLLGMHRYIFELMGLPVPKQVDHRDGTTTG